MAVDRAGEHVLVQSCDELVRGIREVARNLLLDRSSLLVPFRLRVVYVLHASRIQPQGDVQIRCGQGREILRNVLLRIRVARPSELRENRRGLVGGYAGTSS